MTTVWSETYGLSHTGKRLGGDCLATAWQPPVTSENVSSLTSWCVSAESKLNQ